MIGIELDFRGNFGWGKEQNCEKEGGIEEKGISVIGSTETDVEKFPDYHQGERGGARARKRRVLENYMKKKEDVGQKF